MRTYALDAGENTCGLSEPSSIWCTASPEPSALNSSLIARPDGVFGFVAANFFPWSSNQVFFSLPYAIDSVTAGPAGLAADALVVSFTLATGAGAFFFSSHAASAATSAASATPNPVSFMARRLEQNDEGRASSSPRKNAALAGQRLSVSRPG